MANPQLENGYTKIANELLEALCQLNISGREMRILFYILRRTYGFNCKSALISLSEISAATGIKKNHVQENLKRLLVRNVISIQANHGIKPQEICVVKDYEKWIYISVDNCTKLPFPNTGTVPEYRNSTVPEYRNSTVPEYGNSTVPEYGNYTYKENKENIKERKKEKSSAHFGEKNRAFVNDDNYKKLQKEYGAATVDKYISRVDKWAFKNNKNLGECSEYIWKWLEQDNVQKVDPVIEDYYRVALSATQRDFEELLEK